MKRYQKMKDSGVDWIGKIPEHWKSVALRYVFKPNKGKIPKETFGERKNGMIPYQSMDSLRTGNVDKYCHPDEGVSVHDGDILILWDGSNAGELLLAKRGILSSTMSLLDLKSEELIKNYGYYLLKSWEKEIRNNTVGMGIPHVEGTYLKSLKLILPPKPEQAQIVAFLDKKTDKIDSLIANKERKIELLKEKRKALVNQAVTKGLDPEAPMKDSGVEWIGEIPEGWEAVKLRRFCNVQQGLQIKKANRLQVRVENSYEYITTASVHNPEKPKEYILEPNKSVICEKDDILYARTGNTGEVVTNISGVFHNNFFKINFNRSRINKDYFHWFLLNPRFREHILLMAGTTTIPDLNHDAFLSSRLPLPTMDTQTEIVKFLNEQTFEIDQLIQKENQKIELLKEYRQSLIAEVVTGKIDIRDEADAVLADEQQGVAV